MDTDLAFLARIADAFLFSVPQRHRLRQQQSALLELTPLIQTDGFPESGTPRTREIRLSEMRGGLVETWAMGVRLRSTGKPVDKPLNPRATYATFLSDRLSKNGHPSLLGVQAIRLEFVVALLRSV